MRFVLFDEERIGLITGEDSLRDLTETVRRTTTGEPEDPILAMIRHWNSIRPELTEQRLLELPELALSEVRMRPPILQPGKIIAAPQNYHEPGRGTSSRSTVAELGIFLKASSSVIGPGEVVELPYRDRLVDQEGELACVVGRKARHVPAMEAFDYLFGYTCLIDISLQGQETRSTRKSFDTFSPIGPAIVTGDEVGDPGKLDLKCWVNGELRQAANTRTLIYSVPKLVEYASSIMTLHPGDIITTGTPAGVGTLRNGDRIVVEIENIGRLEVDVSNRYAL